MTRKINHRYASLTLTAGALSLAAGTAQADQVILDDLIVDGSACIGLDCVNGESFGFDTIRIKENNLRIKAQDTSSTASFPSNDWQLTFNDSSNGGANKFSVDDISGGRTPFTIEAGARTNALYVDDGGRIGIGTATPVATLHAKTGNTPTLRLEQDGTSGFTAQTWDLAGNEANLFLRDATNGSTLPFRLFPGAPSNALVIEASGEIGLGTTSPDGPLHIRDNSVYITLDDADNGDIWYITHQAGNDGNFEFTSVVDGGAANLAMSLTPTGDMTLAGGLITTGGGGLCTLADPCDAVFDPSVYTVPSIEDHAAIMWENKHLPAVGPTGPDMPINMTEKMLRMLNELEHAHIYIEQLHERLEVLEQKVVAQ